MASFSIVNCIDSYWPNRSAISSLVMPRAFSRTVTGCLRFRSILTLTMSFLSISNSSHDPRLGMIFAEKMSLSSALPEVFSKYTPGDRTNCETTTRSVPLTMNVPLSVMSGKSPMKTVCDLISPVSALKNSAVTNSGCE